MAAEQKNLSVLGFVPTYAAAGRDYALSWYDYGKGYVPASLKPTVDKVEGTVTGITAPYAAKLQSVAEGTLCFADAKVSGAVSSAQGVVTAQRDFHHANLEHYTAARQAYLKKIEEVVDYVKDKGLAGSASAALESVTSYLAQVKRIPGYAYDKAAGVMASLRASFEELLKSPTVSSLLEKAKPGTNFAVAKYMTVHDYVVSAPQYKALFDTAAKTVAYAQDTSVVKAAYGVVQPVAGPAVSTVQGSDYYKALLKHVQPAKLA